MIRVAAAVVACIAALHLFVLETDRGSPGVMTRVTKPVVHRMWKNLSTFPVSRTRWETVGFTVDDYDHVSAYKFVAKHGYAREWKTLPNYAAKADLVRYVVLYELGGWWADADVEPKPDITQLASTRKTVLFHEACGYQWINQLKHATGLSTITHSPQYRGSIYAMPAKTAVMRDALRLLQSRMFTTKQPWSITTQIDATGPGVLTDAVNLHPRRMRQATVVKCKIQRLYMHHHGLRSWY